jgi:hypothetical protein
MLRPDMPKQMILMFRFLGAIWTLELWFFATLKVQMTQQVFLVRVEIATTLTPK